MKALKSYFLFQYDGMTVKLFMVNEIQDIRLVRELSLYLIVKLKEMVVADKC